MRMAIWHKLTELHVRYWKISSWSHTYARCHIWHIPVGLDNVSIHCKIIYNYSGVQNIVFRSKKYLWDGLINLCFQIFGNDLLKLPTKLREKVVLLPGIIRASRADSTTQNYCGSFLRFQNWAKTQGIKESVFFFV